MAGSAPSRGSIEGSRGVGPCRAGSGRGWLRSCRARPGVPVVPGRLRRGVRAAPAVGPVQEPQALVFLSGRRKQVPDIGAADVAEPAGGAAPPAFIWAGAQAQAGVVWILRAAVFAFGEQAGGGLEAAVAQPDAFRRAGRAGVQVEEPALVRPVCRIAGCVEAADRDGEHAIGSLHSHCHAGDRYGLLLRHGTIPSCEGPPGAAPPSGTGLGSGSGWVPCSSVRTSTRPPRTGLQPTRPTASGTSPMTTTSPMDSGRSSRS